jgi:hypothetical protein
MTIASQDRLHDHFAASRSSLGGYAKPAQLDHDFVVVALVSLLGLAVTALALASGATPELGEMAAFLG